MPVTAARSLLDLGFSHIYELRGRAPEALFEEVKKKANPPQDHLYAFRMAVYFAETEAPDPQRLQLVAWQDQPFD